MIDYATARRTMVDNQVRPSDVTDAALLDAFESVPREAFVPDALKPLAYIDEHLPLATAGGPGRFVMQAAPLARLLQLAEIVPADRVLVVGAGTGYAAAIVGRLGAAVVALEENPALAAAARAALAAAGAAEVVVVEGPLQAGAAAHGPYDLIVFDGAVEEVPAGFAGQLAEGGRIVVVEGTGLAGRARLYRRSGDGLSGRTAFNCAARPLPGFARTPAFVF